MRKLIAFGVFAVASLTLITATSEAVEPDRYSANEAVQNYDGQQEGLLILYPILTDDESSLVYTIECEREVHNIKLFAVTGEPNLWTYTAFRNDSEMKVIGAVIIAPRGIAL